MDQVQRLYLLIKDDIDWNNLVPICLRLAQEIQQLTHLRGQEKLELLQSVLNHALDISQVENKKEIQEKIQYMVPIVLQTAKVASRFPIVTKVLRCC
jgi:hypothetical protein